MNMMERVVANSYSGEADEFDKSLSITLTRGAMWNADNEDSNAIIMKSIHEESRDWVDTMTKTFLCWQFEVKVEMVLRYKYADALFGADNWRLESYETQWIPVFFNCERDDFYSRALTFLKADIRKKFGDKQKEMIRSGEMTKKEIKSVHVYFRYGKPMRRSM